MNGITIPAGVFDDLAAGYGDERAMRLLRSGQRARRLLLLAALADAREQSRPWLSVLAEAESTDVAAVAEVVGHPLLEWWLTGCLSGKESIGYLGRLAAAAAARARLPFELGLDVQAGGALPLPTLGELTGLDGRHATLAGKGDMLIVECGSTRLELAWPFTSAADHWRPRPPAGFPGGQVAIEDTDPYRDCFGFPVADRLEGVPLKEFQLRLGEAWSILETGHPGHARSMRASLRAIVPLKDPADGTTVSSSARGAFGAVAVSVTMSAEALALQLLHEYMHMKLWAFMDLVTLHGEGGQARHFAPWRGDPRTVPALLQGTYAHLGVSEFWRERRRGAGGRRRLEAELQYGFWLEQTRAAAATLLGSGELTEEGTRFVRRLGLTLSQWAREPVEARETSRDLVTAASVAWRLRNTHPSPHFIAQLTRSRTAGLPCPSRLEDPQVVPADAEGWQPSALEQLIRRRYVNGATGGCEDPAHRAFLNGDYEAARSHYRRLLRREPARHDVWCGLAIALAKTGDKLACEFVTARPDLVRAVTASTGDDPVAVAQWLGQTKLLNPAITK